MIVGRFGNEPLTEQRIVGIPRERVAHERRAGRLHRVVRRLEILLRRADRRGVLLRVHRSGDTAAHQLLGVFANGRLIGGELRFEL